jgi:hypothetical protein
MEENYSFLLKNIGIVFHVQVSGEGRGGLPFLPKYRSSFKPALTYRQTSSGEPIIDKFAH